MTQKKDYILDELWILAWNASVQHAFLYKKGAWKDNRIEISEFKEKVVSYLAEKIIPRYKNRVDENMHCKNITELIGYANKVDNGILGVNGYKYGVAQKLLNLSLKYYWCVGEIEEPPHCPVDKIVIDKTRLKGKVNWTQILRESEYIGVINAIKELATSQGSSVARWELDNYERR